MQIPLTRGLFAQIDDADASLVAGRSWQARPIESQLGGFYAQSADGRSTVYMHRIIAGAKLGQFVDHINRDGLDNRRGNLRLYTRSQNNCNRAHPRSQTGFRGVEVHRQRYRACVYDHGKRICVGTFCDPVSAARAFDVAATSLYGEFARLNFPRSR